MQMYDAFKLHDLSHKVAFKYESIATFGDHYMIGTTDGKIMVYRAKRNENTEGYEPDAIVMHTSRHGKPIRQMAAIPDKRIVVVQGGDALYLHRLDINRLREDRLAEIKVLGQLKEVQMFHTKKDKGKYYICVAQRKKLSVLEYDDATEDFRMTKDGLTLPEGLRSLLWVGKKLVLGFRKEYCFMDYTQSGTPEQSVPTGKSSIPLACNLDPLDELLLVPDDQLGVRVTVDGRPIKEAKPMQWGSLPQTMIFAYPYFLSIHDTNSIEIRNPFLSECGGRECQIITIKQVDKLSCRNILDVDQPKPDKVPLSSIPNYRKDIIVAINSSNSVFLLEMIPIKQQAIAMAQQKNFDLAIELCRLCPSEVPPAAMTELKTLCGLSAFQKPDFDAAMNWFAEGKVDPRLPLFLFPHFIPPKQSGWRPTIGNKPFKPPIVNFTDQAVLQKSLVALVGFLQPLRRPPPTPDEERLSDEQADIYPCVDYALLKCYGLLRRERDLVCFVESPHFCDQADVEEMLRSSGHWVALVAHYKASARHIEIAQLLVNLASGGEERTRQTLPTGKPHIMKVVHTLLDNQKVVSGRSLTLQSVLCEEAKKHFKPADEIDEKFSLNMIVGTITLLWYLRELNPSDSLSRRVLFDYSPWLLANIAPKHSLTIFTQPDSHHDPQHIVDHLQSVPEAFGSVKSLHRVAKYLDFILGEDCSGSDVQRLHNLRLQSLIEMVMLERKEGEMIVTESEEILIKFLTTSKHYNKTTAISNLEEGNAKPYAKSFYRERSIVYAMEKKHEAALSMFINELSDMEGAKKYASEVAKTRDRTEPDPFILLLQRILIPGPNRSSASCVEEAIHVVTSCEGVDAQTALPLLPDDTPLVQLHEFLKSALRNESSKRMEAEIERNMMKYRLQNLMRVSFNVRGRSTTIKSQTLCQAPQCGKKIRVPDTTFARYPNGTVVHQACLDNEHVCPRTQYDFNHELEVLLSGPQRDPKTKKSK